MKTKALQFILPLFIAIFLVPQVSFADFTTNLKYGDRGEKIAELQEFLIIEGFLTEGNATGNFFSLTKKAVKDFQTAHNLPSTGYFGILSRGVANSLLTVDEPIESADLFSGVEVKPKVEVQNDQLNVKIQELETKIIQLTTPQPMPEPVDLSEIVIQMVGNPIAIEKAIKDGYVVYPYKIMFKDSKGLITQSELPIQIEVTKDGQPYEKWDTSKEEYKQGYGYETNNLGEFGVSYKLKNPSKGTYLITATYNGKTKTETFEVK